MTLQKQQATTENAPAVLTDEQRRRVAVRSRERTVREHSQELRQPVREIQDLVRVGIVLSTHVDGTVPNLYVREVPLTTALGQ